jgi:hypothetical protein
MSPFGYSSAGAGVAGHPTRFLGGIALLLDGLPGFLPGPETRAQVDELFEAE